MTPNPARARLRAELARRKAAGAPGPRTLAELARALGVTPSGLRAALSGRTRHDPAGAGRMSIAAIEAVLGPADDWPTV